MSFRISGLDPKPFMPLFGLSDAELAQRGIERMRVTQTPGFPDRVMLRDLEVGETALLLNYTHQPANTPYHASHAIFICQGSTLAFEAVDCVPEALRIRPLSVRAFDVGHSMIDADLVDGADAAACFERLLLNPAIAYLQVHYAKRGCYAARVERA